MRLQLTVQRQGLPPVHVLWDAYAIRPNHDADGASKTIAQLLEQINEVIPLEAEEWGLEDYVVEVNSFECLHFCTLDIFRENDLVTVRPLQTSDVRYRRMSGRHQISSDGKHLIDGVAFGRPFLRRSDRPPIRIPSRKRIRLTFEDEAGSNGLATSTIYGAPSRHADTQALEEQSNDSANDENFEVSDQSSNSDDDEDLEICEEENNLIEELQEELQDLTQNLQEVQDLQALQNNLDRLERTVYLDGVEEPSKERQSRKRKRGSGLGLSGSGILKLLESGEGHFAGAYNNPLLDQYYHDEPVKSSNGIMKQQRTRKLPSVNTTRKIRKPVNPEVRSRRSSSASLKSVRFEKRDIETPATIRDIADSESEDDVDYDPGKGPSSRSTESNKENVQPQAVIRASTESSTDVQSNSSISSDSESDSTDTSSSVSSSSNNTSSCGDTENEVSKQKSADNRPKTKSSPEVPPKGGTSEFYLTQAQVVIHTPPEQGRRRTQKRNARRRVHNKIGYLKSKAILPPTATINDYNAYLERSGKIESPQQELEQSKDDASAFETKRKSLLDSIQSDGVDINEQSLLQTEIVVEGQRDDLNREVEPYPGVGTPEISQKVPRTAPHSLPSKILERISTREPTGPSSESKLDPSDISKRRKLDLASSRRLLFGSLGLRTPKTKEDEERLREKLMENIKPVHHAQGLQSVNAIDNEDDSWKDQIILRAVECCDEGVVLSTPPFPFVQRWDPQQKGQYNELGGGPNGNKRKKRRRAKEQFIQEDEEEVDIGNSSALVEEADALLPTSLSHDFEVTEAKDRPVESVRSDDYQIAVDKQLMRDAFTHISTSVPLVDDLPILPEDMSTLPALTRQVAGPGAVIAFKQLDMSQDTNWQPLVSIYRTAMIIEVLEDDFFRVSLAQRDRPKAYVQYDEKSGERIYSKFEMPDFENEHDVEEENGTVELSLADMIDPKVVKFAVAVIEQPLTTEVLDAGVETIDMFEEDEEDDGSLEERDDLEVHGVAEVQTVTKESTVQKLSLNDLAEELPVRTRDDLTMMATEHVNEDARHEISLIIKDAGFRSNVNSDLERGLTEHNREMISPTNDRNALEANECGPQSPKFHGFSSSPPTMENNKHMAQSSIEAQHTPSGISGPTIVDMESSQGHEPLEVFRNLHNGTAAGDWHDKEVENDDVTYPTLSSNSYTDVPLGKNHGNIYAVDSDSSQSTRITKGTRKTTRSQDVLNRRKVLDSAINGTDSDDESPFQEKALRNVHRTLKDDRPRNHEIRKLENANKAFESIRTATRRETPAFSIADVRASSSPSPDVEAEDVKLPLPTLGSQPPPGTQIVDLTFSSDPVEPDMSDYEERNASRGLPNGPGWVNKTRNAAKGRAMGGKTMTRKTRSM